MLEKAILYDFHFFLSRSDSLVNFRYFQALSYRNLDCLFPPLSNLETYLGPYQILWWKLLRKYYSTRNSFIKTYFIGVWEDPKLMFVDIGHILMKYFFFVSWSYSKNPKTNKRDMTSLHKFPTPYSAFLFLLELEMDFSILSCNLLDTEKFLSYLNWKQNSINLGKIYALCTLTEKYTWETSRTFWYLILKHCYFPINCVSWHYFCYWLVWSAMKLPPWKALS